jgi:DNA replication protein DnaC
MGRGMLEPDELKDSSPVPRRRGVGNLPLLFDEGAELLFQILAARYETLSTIITTNLPFSEWIKVFHDKTLTASLLDRITHRAIVVNMNGESYRRRKN